MRIDRAPDAANAGVDTASATAGTTKAVAPIIVRRETGAPP